MSKLPSSYGLASHALHAGELEGDAQHSHVAPIYQTSTFSFADVAHGQALFSGEQEGNIYTRWGNPTIRALEQKIAALEAHDLRRNGGPELPLAGMAFSSGMGAISSLLLTLLRPGDTLLTHGGLYGGTDELMAKVLTDLGIITVVLDLNDTPALERAIAAAQRPRVVYIESPANPALQMTDIAQVASLAHQHGLQVITDNTFATPILQQPLALGADFVIHSTTKYLNGHGTTVGGMVVARDAEFVRGDLWTRMKLLGTSPSPFDAWLINQGIKTLALRMQQHCANAQAVAEWLSGQAKVDAVHYPGLPDFPQHELARRQMKGFGGMVAFELKGGLEAGAGMMNRVRLATLAVSLGVVDTLIQHPASMTHVMIPTQQRRANGISDGLVRLSVGIEEAADIIDDLDQALNGA